MTKSYVNLSAPSYDNKDMSPRAKEQLFNLALHETGHALGIDGHSPSGLDVMYFKSPLIKLSDRDANTIRKNLSITSSSAPVQQAPPCTLELAHR